MKKSILFCVLSSVLMSGCSALSGEEVEKSPVPVYEPSPVSEKEVYDAFIAAAKNADEALRIYTEVNTASKREELTYEKIRQAQFQASYIPKGMERTISMEWEGPIRPVLNQLAREVDYKVRIIGDLPPVPHTVTFVAHEKPIIEVLRDIDSKVKNININVYENKDANIIEVIYVDGFN
jgi:hypothetical protein